MTWCLCSSFTGTSNCRMSCFIFRRMMSWGPWVKSRRNNSLGRSTCYLHLLKLRLLTLVSPRSSRDWIKLTRPFAERHCTWHLRWCKKHTIRTRLIFGPLVSYCLSYSTRKHHFMPRIDRSLRTKSKLVATIWGMHVKIFWRSNAFSFCLSVFSTMKLNGRAMKSCWRIPI